MVPQQPTPPLVVFSLTRRLVAMNAHTGQHVWEYETGGSFEGRLFVEQGLVFYTVNRGILCLDYLTGALRWHAQLPGSVGMTEGRLVVFAGCVIVLAMGEAVCLNAQTGAQIWYDPFKGYGSGSGAIAAPGVASQVDKGR
jgi:outer membrane protein assembly factor BamB